MTTVNVRLTGAPDAVRRAADALSAAAGVGEVSIYPPRTFYPKQHRDPARAYLQVEVPDEEDAPLLVFEDLPAEDSMVAELQARPGEWAAVLTYASESTARRTASLIRTGKRRGYVPADAYEAKRRQARNGSGQWVVYARYVGDEGGGRS